MKAGLRNAKAKGKQLGRPRKILDTKRIATLRAKGVGWKRIAAEMGVGVGTIYRVALEGSKIRQGVFELQTRRLSWPTPTPWITLSATLHAWRTAAVRCVTPRKKDPAK